MLIKIIDNSDPLAFAEQMIVPIADKIFLFIIILGCVWLIWKQR